MPKNTIFNTFFSVNIFPCDSYSKDSTLLLENFYATFFKIFLILVYSSNGIVAFLLIAIIGQKVHNFFGHRPFGPTIPPSSPSRQLWLVPPFRSRNTNVSRASPSHLFFALEALLTFEKTWDGGGQRIFFFVGVLSLYAWEGGVKKYFVEKSPRWRAICVLPDAQVIAMKSGIDFLRLYHTGTITSVCHSPARHLIASPPGHPPQKNR